MGTEDAGLSPGRILSPAFLTRLLWWAWRAGRPGRRKSTSEAPYLVSTDRSSVSRSGGHWGGKRAEA